MNLTDTLKCARCYAPHRGRTCGCELPASEAGAWAFVFVTMLSVGVLAFAVAELLS